MLVSLTRGKTHNVIRPLISKGLVTNNGEGATKQKGGGSCEALPLRKEGGGC